MGKKIIYLLGMGLTILSCSNDSSFFMSNEVCGDWQTSLNEIISGNKDIFADMNVEITDVKLMKEMKLDTSFFYDNKYGYFPVFSKHDSIIEIIQYDEIDKRSNEYSFNKEIINKKINRLIQKSDDYDIIQLTWHFGNDNFKSLSLFNKRTGELEYDNMLFNMNTISKYDGSKFILLLQKAESFPANFSGSQSVRHTINGSTVASSSISWNVWGHWINSTYLTYEDSLRKRYMTVYTYCYDSARITPSKYYTGGFDAFNQYGNYSVVYEPRYSLKYALWAGPVNDLDTTHFILNAENNTGFQGRFRVGQGILETISGSPRRDPDYYEVLK